jgi:integrase/recombinase XerD
MIVAARATGARQEELAGACHLHLDRKAKRLTVLGKRNNLRVIDLEPFGGSAIFDSLPEGIANAPLFWHGKGERAGSPYSPMNLQQRTQISSASGSMTCGIFMRLNGCDREARFTRCSIALGHDSIKTTDLKYLTPEEQLRAKGLAPGTNSGPEVPPTDQANV